MTIPGKRSSSEESLPLRFRSGYRSRPRRDGCKLLMIGLFVVLELVSNDVMEPWLYGNGIGITPIALIVAALVWTTLWGQWAWLSPRL